MTIGTTSRLGALTLPILLTALLAAACGDDASGTGGADATSSAETTSSTSTSSSTSVATTTSSSGTGDGGAGGQGAGGETGGHGGGGATGSGGSGGSPLEVDLGELVINEVSLDGLDWIELYNPGDEAVDLAGVRIADQDKDAPGTPKLTGAVTFEGEEAIVDAGGFLFVLADQDPLLEGPQETCAPGAAPCFHTGWGLSTADGDIVFLLAPDDSVLQQVDIASNAAIEPTTWGRLPDGTGAFGVTAATPSAANAPAK